MSISQELLDYYQGVRDDRIVTGLKLEINNQAWWFCDEIFDFTALIDGVSQTLEARALMVQRPARSGNGNFQSSIQIDDVDRALWQAFQSVDRTQAIFVTVYLILYGTQKNEITWRFQIDSSSFDGSVCSISASKPRIVNQKFPLDIYTVDAFPGLEAI